MSGFLRALRPGARRPALPGDARTALALDGSDAPRVLAWAELVGGGWAAATPVGLRAALPTGTTVDRPWEAVDRAAWEAESRMLAVWWVGSRAATAIELSADSRLPDVVHDRVQGSVVLSTDVDVPGGTVRVALRKAHDGTLTTQTVPGRGVRLKDPETARRVAAAEATVRSDAGLSARRAEPMQDHGPGFGIVQPADPA